MTLLVAVHDLMKRPGQMREIQIDHLPEMGIGTSVVEVPAK